MITSKLVLKERSICVSTILIMRIGSTVLTIEYLRYHKISGDIVLMSSSTVLTMRISYSVVAHQ